MKLSTKHQTLNTHRGFSLIELAVVLGIIAVVLGVAITLFTASLEGRALRTTQARLAALQQALYDYRLAYNRLPCPANLTLATSSATYGIAAATTSDCTGGSPAANLGNSSAAFGMVPVRTLGLPDDAAFDGWGRRISYGVSTPFVATDAFTTIAITDTTARITVKTLSDVDITLTAAFVLASHGKNGHGGYSSVTAQAVDSGVTNTDELKNSKRSSGFVLETTNIATYFQGEETPDPSNSLNNFDDVVVFSTRAQLRGPNE